MRKLLMTDKEIQDIIRFEDECGVNSLLQLILTKKDNEYIFKIVDEKGLLLDYCVE